MQQLKRFCEKQTCYLSKCAALGLAFAASLCAAWAQCPLNVPQPNIGANYIAMEPAWWNFDFSQADNASYASNYVFADNAGIPPGPYLSWCIDTGDGINGNGQVYTDVGYYSSCGPNLDQELPQDFPLSV